MGAKNKDFHPGRILEKFACGRPPARAAKFCYIWVCLLPHSSSPWHESCPFISGGSPTSGSVERGQGQVPSHLCPSQMHGQLQLATEGHLGVSAESWAAAGIGAGLGVPPSLWSTVFPIRLESPWRQRLCLPPSDWEFPSSRGCSSIRLEVPWGQRMCLPNQPGSS